MKKLLTYLCAILLLAACSNEIPEHNQPVKAKRTILAYLSANNDLDGYIMQNVKWMYESLSQAKDTCTLVIYYKPTPNNKILDNAEILEFQTNGFGEINNQPVLTGNQLTTSNIIAQAKHHEAIPGNSVHLQVMEDNLKYMQELAPSKSYGLLFGSHATGWLPASASGLSTFSFGKDERYAINIPKLGQTLKSSFSNKNLDFILFDACMMGVAEACYELRNATHYCIASVMETPAVGFPYHLFLKDLYEEKIDYAQVCQTTTDFNRKKGLWGTYAAIDCTQMDKLAEVVKGELIKNKEKLAQLTPHNFLENIQQYGANSFTYFAFDLEDTFRLLSEDVSPIENVLSEVVIAKDCLEKPYANVKINKDKFCGIGMYIPFISGKASWDNYYETLGWYHAAGWDELKSSLLQ